MATIDELVGKGTEHGPYTNPGTDSFEEPIVQQRRGLDLSFLKAETGEGPIESYFDHPLNFNESKGMARILRGATGLFGSLNLAIIDIGIGLLDVMKRKPVIQEAPNQYIGGGQ